jgi:NitT/TauT family transport system substrate-binding protein
MNSALLLTALFKINQVDESAVRRVAYGFGAVVPSLLTAKVDAIPGYVFGEYLAALGERKDVVAFKMSDFGVQSYANGIAVRNQFLERNPEAVGAFVKTTIRGLEYALANREEAIVILAKYTETPARTLNDQFVAATPLLDSPTVRKNGIGVMSSDRWLAGQKLQVDFGDQRSLVPDEKLWTNRFVQ